MNEQEFKELTGYDAENDDLERVNCVESGAVGHYFCGLCKECKQPNFLCRCDKPKIWGYMEPLKDKRTK